jgi:drug/metabolite transporter (DMT)-like permease
VTAPHPPAPGVGKGTLDGLLAAALFGLSAPLSKLLLVDVDPVVLAGLLYLGAGASLAALAGLFALAGRGRGEARLERRDLPWLGGAILVGGVMAPLLLLFGIAQTPAATASLLLTLETAATAGLAALLFREAVGRTTWIAVGLVTAGGLLLALDPQGAWGLSPGCLLIIGACALWGLDNNLTRHVSLRDPKTIVILKGLGAGSVSLLLAVILGRPFPSLGRAAAALVLGAVSYGASIALFVRSLQKLGAARTGALFGTAPFLATAVSLLIFREPPAIVMYGTLPLMLIAAWLLARERHEHAHSHEPIVHAHRHAHDEHHIHPHVGEEPIAGAHTHEHAHEVLVHVHAHRPDGHHRHTHAGTD